MPTDWISFLGHSCHRPAAGSGFPLLPFLFNSQCFLCQLSLSVRICKKSLKHNYNLRYLMLFLELYLDWKPSQIQVALLVWWTTFFKQPPIRLNSNRNTSTQHFLQNNDTFKSFLKDRIYKLEMGNSGFSLRPEFLRWESMRQASAASVADSKYVYICNYYFLIYNKTTCVYKKNWDSILQLHLHKLNTYTFFIHHFVKVELKNFFVDNLHRHLARTKVIWTHLMS